jgi:TonB-linked SusC/RagA family outer membrane protein
MKRLFLGLVPILLFVCCVSAFAQKTVSGRITSADDGAPLRGARVVAKGTKVGAFSDARGQYKITLPEGATALVFNSVGYVPREVAVGDQTAVNVSLNLDAKALDDVVVTAFGVKQEKKALGYSVQEIGSQEIKSTNQPNIVASLQGRVAGVTITGSGGGVGAGSQIIIRGVSSLSPGANNQPLFVVDGIPISNDTQSGNVLPSTGSNSPNSAEQFAFTNRAADINPDDIESINILKGPAATALYGLRAANGVVIITTKKGLTGKTQITFSSNVTIEEVGQTPAVQSKWGQGGGADTTDNRTNFWSFGIPRSLSGGNDAFFDNYRNFFRVGQRYDQNLNISGGTANTKYFMSVSRMDQVGIVPGTDFQRTTVSLRASNDFDDRLSFSGSVNYSNSGGNRPSGGDRSIFSALNFWIPSYDINDVGIAASPVGQRVTAPYSPIRTPDGRITNINYTDGVIDSPLFYALRSPLSDNVNRVFGDIKLDYKPFEWLTAVYQFTMDYYNDARRRIAPPEVGPAQALNGFIIEQNINRREINSQLVITAAQKFDDVDVSLTVGNAITDIESSGIFARGERLGISGFLDVSNTINRFNTREFAIQRLVGVFADARISYKDFLFLNLTARNDWSSTLPSQNRSFFYPSASLGFVFSELFKGDAGMDWLSFGKLRASWAEVGKDGIGPYRIGEYYDVATGFPFNNPQTNTFLLGYRVSPNAGSTTLRPERTTGLEFGLEAKFFERRLGLDVAYFIQDIRDQIVNLPVSQSSGFNTFLVNGGSIQNTGIEVLLTATPILTNDFSWDITLNWSRLRGSITSIAEGINEIVFFDNAGVAISKATRPTPDNPNPAVGDLYGLDFRRDAQGRVIISADGFPTVNVTRQVKVGNALPDWQGGITNSFSWNGLSLSFLLEFRQGGLVHDMAERNRFRNGISGWTEPRYQNMVFRGVNEAGETNTTPVLWTQTGINTTNLLYRSFGRVIDAYPFNFQDASWIRLRNVSLTYSLPRAILGEDSFVKVLRFTLTGNNLWLSTPFYGFDPDNLAFGAGSNNVGFVGRNTPATRSYAFGVSVTF